MKNDGLAATLADTWQKDKRWQGIARPYTPEEVLKLRGTLQIDHTLARRGAEKLWRLFEQEPYVHALGAVTGNQAVQMVDAGLQAIYVSGWQVAGDANLAEQMYPDQSLYPVNSAPALTRRINNALRRADQIAQLDGRTGVDHFVPLVVDAESGFGGVLNTFELMKGMIEAGAAAVHLEDQLSSLKKCGHMGGKVLVPTQDFLQKLVACRLAADVEGVPTLLVARTDANSAQLLRSDIDPRDHAFLTGERTPEGYFRVSGGLEMAIARGIASAPYAELLWCETSEPNLEEAKRFAEGVHQRFPGKWLAYNCSPSFNWKRKLDNAAIAKFQRELGAMGYKFQFVTLAGFHALNLGMFELARGYHERDMAAFADLQEREFEREAEGFRAVKHQSFVGAGYFDQVAQAITRGSTTAAMTGSTEEEQFTPISASKVAGKKNN